MICSNCGNEIMDGSKFCIHCGAKVEEAVSAPEVNNDSAAEPADGVTVMPDASDASASVDETLDTAQEAYEQAASDLSDTAEEAIHNETSSGFYENTDTSYTEYTGDDEGGGNIGFAIASMVCGCLSILCCFGTCVSWVLSIVAIVLGVITLTKKYDGRGFAIAGIVTAGVGIILSIIMTVAIFTTGALEDIL